MSRSRSIRNRAFSRRSHRARPIGRFQLVHAGGYAFPSGHATQAAAMWGAMAFLLTLIVTSWPRRVAAWTAALLVTGLVGLSRMYLGVHWLSDVLAGWALGSLWLFALLTVRSYLSRNSKAPLSEPSKVAS